MDKKGPAMKMMRWGLIPAWSKTEKLETELINAKAETLKEKPSYRQAYEKRRCLVPADSFYEWQEREGKRQPSRIMFKSGEPFCFAGLWDRWIRPASNEQGPD